MEENQNFTVTVNDASETIILADESPAPLKTAAAVKTVKGGTTDAPVIP